MRIIKKILLNSKSLKNDYYKYNLKASQDNYIKTDAGSNIEKNILLENHEKQKETFGKKYYKDILDYQMKIKIGANKKFQHKS